MKTNAIKLFSLLLIICMLFGVFGACAPEEPEKPSTEKPTEQPKYDCTKDGHKYANGLCIECGAKEPYDCAMNGHKYVDGACTECNAKDPTDLSVRDFTSENGVVTSANPYASLVGLEVLKNGGNAFDAAVAVAFAIGVAEPDANGLGGGGVMVSYNTKTHESKFYNFREFASLSYDGSKSGKGTYVAVPTQLVGLNKILSDLGTMDLQTVIAPSIKLASEGVVVTPELADNILGYLDKILECGDRNIKNVFGGLDPLAEGDLLVQPDLAKTLQMISDNGIESFYTGEFAQKLVDTIQSEGGYVTMEDFAHAMQNYPKVSDCISGTYGDYSIMTAGSPSTGGTMLIEMLNMLESYKNNGGSLVDLGLNSAEYVNLISTVQQLAYGDKEKYMADASFVDVPYVGLTNKSYAAQRIAKYSVGQAYLGTGLSATELPFGDPMPFNGGAVQTYEMTEQGSHYSTTSFSVADKEGNLVTFTQTINNFFGVGLVSKGTGFFLNDQMRDFSKTEGSINSIEAGKQPASYMMPTVLLKNGQPFATLGTPGGSRIPAAMLQVILNMVEFNMDLQSAINSPRFYCYTTTEVNRNDTKKGISIEKALENLTNELSSMNYDVLVEGHKDIDSYFGGVQGIEITPQGMLHGGADFRRDGKALGY